MWPPPSSWLIMKAEVGRIELPASLKAFPIDDLHGLPTPLNDLFSPEVVQDAVGVDGRDAKAVPELGLSDRHREAVILGKANDIHAGVKLTKHMGHALMGRFAPNVQKPLAGDVAVNERAEPQQACQVRMAVSDLPQGRMGDDGNRAGGESPILWSICSKGKLCRSKKSPEMCRAMIWRRPSSSIM